MSFDWKHALAVAGRVDGLDAKIVALLHDIVEDCGCGYDELGEAGLPDEVIAAIETLTRLPDEPYVDYIARIKNSGDELAIYVKLADLDANLARSDEAHASLSGRYHQAEAMLKGAS